MRLIERKKVTSTKIVLTVPGKQENILVPSGKQTHKLCDILDALTDDWIGQDGRSESTIGIDAEIEGEIIEKDVLDLSSIKPYTNIQVVGDNNDFTIGCFIGVDKSGVKLQMFATGNDICMPLDDIKAVLVLDDEKKD